MRSPRNSTTSTRTSRFNSYGGSIATSVRPSFASCVTSSASRFWRVFRIPCPGPSTSLSASSYYLPQDRARALDLEKPKENESAAEKKVREQELQRLAIDRATLRWSHFKQMKAEEMLPHVQLPKPFIAGNGGAHTDYRRRGCALARQVETESALASDRRAGNVGYGSEGSAGITQQHLPRSSLRPFRSLRFTPWSVCRRDRLGQRPSTAGKR